MKSYSVKTVWITLVLAVLVLPSILIVIWFAYNDYQKDLERALIKETFLNVSLEKKLEYKTGTLIRLLENKSETIAHSLLNKHNNEYIQTIFKVILEKESALHGLILVSDKGKVLSSVDHSYKDFYQSENTDVLSNNHWNLQWENEIRSAEFVVPVAGRNYISHPRLHEGRCMINISVPVRYENKTQAFLVAEIDINELWKSRLDDSTNAQSVSYLVNSVGVLITNINNVKYKEGDVLTHLDIVGAATAHIKWKANHTYTGLSGEKVFGTVQPIQVLDWFVVTEINEIALLGPIKETIKNAVILIIVIILVSIYIGLRMLHLMMTPIQKVTDAMQKYALDEVSVKEMPLTNIDEINTVIHGFNRMLVERTRMDNVLRASKQRLALHREQAPLGVIEWTTGFEFVDWNPAAEKIFGFAKQEVVGKHITETILPESAREAVEVVWQQLLDNAGGTHSINENRTKDGRVIVCEWHNTSLVDESGKVVGVASFVEDVTQQKLQEDQIRQTQKMDALGKLTGGISHDFNNLLNAILGYADLIKDYSDNEEIKKYASVILTAGQRGSKLTNKLLRFSSQETHQVSVIDINAVIKDEYHILEKSLTARINLMLNMDDDIWPVCIDSADLQDAVLNMCINAMHAIHGNGNLTITTTNVYLDNNSVKNMDVERGDFVMLKITDTGNGMDDVTLSHIFDPFFSTKGEKGTGLGLSQVYGFVKRSGGMLTAKSKLNVGTEIILYFPRYLQLLTEEVSEAEPELEIASIDLGGNERILVVDDEEGLRELCVTLLEAQGYRVASAKDGEEALSMLENQSFDLVLSDVVMPAVDGFQLAETIQQRWPTIKIQLVSGFTDGLHNNVNVESLHRNLIHKPYKIEMLLKRIRTLLDE